MPELSDGSAGGWPDGGILIPVTLLALMGSGCWTWRMPRGARDPLLGSECRIAHHLGGQTVVESVPYAGRVNLLRRTVAVVEAAGRIVLEAANRGLQLDQKTEGDLVTNADREVDAFLKVELNGILPAAWLSEESADDPDRLGCDAVWIVDPLDGTLEFAQGIREYTVAVALVALGQPVLGVVHNPATGDSFWAVRGSGAFRNGDPIRVNEGATLLASRSEVARGEFVPLADTWTLRPMGSVQLKLALVAAAEGAVTLSRGPKHEWDVCAGALIVSEAGGFATDMFGGRLCYNRGWPKVKGILAGAPRAYRRALGQLADIGPSRRMAEFSDAPSGSGST